MADDAELQPETPAPQGRRKTPRTRRMRIALAAVVLLTIVASAGYYAWDRYFSPFFLPGIELDVPPGYTLTRTEGIDFDVYYLTPSGERSSRKGSLGVYVGWFANPSRRDGEFRQERGTLCGRGVTWSAWKHQGEEGTIHWREAHCRFGGRLGHVTVHAFVLSRDLRQANLLQDIAAGMRVVPERKKDIPPAFTATHPAVETEKHVEFKHFGTKP
ncbi:MAG TPA: hypothetical protein DCX07_04405 [Phycisphaerales bacterium]|nr:hypothetical protein [Phycisphaerales bacterium]